MTHRTTINEKTDTVIAAMEIMAGTKLSFELKRLLK
jgi:hypothetical protein